MEEGVNSSASEVQEDWCSWIEAYVGTLKNENKKAQ